ncbi:hypothetical protein BIV57_09885 [Mangrovactinospora gilvigrisea]|uniref:Sugar ABC transporter substrate-binding protein n=1 Tax=Mangrovactinospora gilvigrisea TaxID=1428644 RepID=A0A1J7BGA0_9ACTN|nr:extracellular solute-binding protein [Mangrovactinospora gilvigrisea]OIV37670.1 hypothetical protein BIV57_09885 [Mangrovactinospora gilvigrisea]
MTDRHHLTRRGLLTAGAGTAAGAALLLTGCDAPRAIRATNIGKKLAEWPDYVPAKAPKPDFPGNDAKGIQSAYLTYPTDLVTAVPEKPGNGETVTVALVTNEPVPPPLGRNTMWRAVNEALGVNLKLNFIPSASLSQKLAVMMASGDVPDIITCSDGVPTFEDFIATDLQDLTDHLSGSAIRDYPNLANLPTYSWQGVGLINGGIYGVPIQRPLPTPEMICNLDAFDKVGGLSDWTPDQFTQRMKALTGKKHWASGPVGKTDVDRHAGWRGAPNSWVLDSSGGFHPTEATAVYKDALAYIQKLVKDGVFYPDQVATPEAKTLMYGQTLYSMADTLPAYATNVAAVGSRFRFDFGRPYTIPGVTPKKWDGPGWVNYTVLKKGTPSRIKLMLRILNFLASPFGSKEYELIRFGVEGKHFTRDSHGQIQLSKLSQVENFNTLPLQYVCSPPLVAYFPGQPDAARRVWNYQTETSKYLVKNPSVGLRTAAKDRYGTVTGQILNDAATNIVNGRASVKSWDDALKEWRKQGGDKIAASLREEYAAVHGH